jgi:hypothetical protein
MSSQLQAKILTNLRGLVEGFGYEVLDHPRFANTGGLHVQDPKKVGDIALIGYSFQDDRYNLTLTVGGQRITSQPPRPDYYDWYLKYDDGYGYENFRAAVSKHLRPATAASRGKAA